MIEIKYSKILVGVDGSKESMDAATHAIGHASEIMKIFPLMRIG